MSYLQSIGRLSGIDNIGGIITLQVMRASEVASMGDPIDGVIYGDITMKPGKASVTWAVTLETARTQSKSRNSREGAIKENQLPFIIPKDRATIKVMLDQAEEDEFIVTFTDTNGTKKVFGTLTTPVKFIFDHDSGAKFDSLNAYECRFYYEGPDNLYHYNGTVPSPIPGAAPAIFYFNGVAKASLQPGDNLYMTSEFGYTEFFIVSS